MTLKVDLNMIDNLSIVDLLTAYCMQNFKNTLDNMNLTNIAEREDKKRKVLKQFMTVADSCKNRMYAHEYSPNEDVMDRLLNSSSAVAVYDEFLKLIEYLEDWFREELSFHIDTSNNITGLLYLDKPEYKKLLTMGVKFI